MKDNAAWSVFTSQLRENKQINKRLTGKKRENWNNLLLHSIYSRFPQKELKLVMGR